MARTKNSIMNVLTSAGGQIISIILSFVTRTVFIYFLGKAYLGLNGLFTQILSVLSLAELGFGTAIVYMLYQPLADNNEEEIACILNFLKKVYQIIGTIIFVLGLCLTPFLEFFIKMDISIPINYHIIYVMYLVDTVTTYTCFAYRSSLLVADQKTYIVKIYDYIYTFIFAIIEIGIIAIFKNYYLYIVARILKNITYNLCVAFVVKKNYPYINNKSKKGLESNVIKKLKSDVYALSLNKIGNTVLNSTDNLLISSFIGISIVGVYSNYAYIITTVGSMLGLCFSPLIASVGNLVVTSTEEKIREVFGHIKFINFKLVTFCSICLAALMNPFIKVWIGNDYVLPTMVVYCIVSLFFVRQMENTTYVFRMSCGAFQQKKYIPLLSAALNLLFSVLLIQPLGLAGIFLGTIISRMLTIFIVDPLIVYKELIKENVSRYYISWLLTLVQTLVGSCILCKIISLFLINNLGEFFIVSIICGSFTLIYVYLIDFRNKQWKYIGNIIKIVLLRKKMK